MKLFRPLTNPLIFLLLVPITFTSGQTTVFLQATKDNTIFSENTNSNALGDLFSGRTSTTTGGSLRRALVRFSMSLIPSNATVIDATLTLTKNKGGSGNTSLHQLTLDWGEGTSLGTSMGGGGGGSPTADDATWDHTFYNTQVWTSSGGDYNGSASATINVGSANTQYNWTSATMVSDVQAWINDSTTNFGWIIIGNESSTSTASRFNSREDGSGFPLLAVTYTMPPVCPDTLMLSGTLLPDTYQAALLIKSDGIVDSPSNVIFDTGLEAILEENFTTILGATFEIKIGGCTP